MVIVFVVEKSERQMIVHCAHITQSNVICFSFALHVSHTSFNNQTKVREMETLGKKPKIKPVLCQTQCALNSVIYTNSKKCA